MFIKIKRLFLVLGLTTLIACASVASVAAADPFNPFATLDCEKAADSTVCQGRNTTDNPLTGSDGLILRVANIIAIVAGAAAVIMIIIGGIQYITSNGDSGGTNTARNTILYSLLGLVVIVLARAVVGFVVSSL